MNEPNAIELILALHEHDKTAPIGKLPGLWERKLDERWTIWVNGHLEPLPAGDGAQMMVHPGDCYVEYNGWPAGSFSIIHPGQGMIAAGAKANYHTFCEAIEKALK